ncbi:MAG: efflux RND transporter periplasmic adaptor subunit [Gemmatimonadales bacterium]
MNRSLLVVAIVALGCGGDKAPAPAAPATVANPVKESDLTHVTLSAEAEQRLAIATAAVESRAMPETRTLGGVVTPPPGRSFTLTAPVAATVLAPASGFPRGGATVRRGAALLSLVPLPPDRDLLRGDEELSIAEVRVRQAEAEAARMEALAKDSLVSRRDLERALAARDEARTARDAAQARLERQRTGAVARGPGLTALTIASPDDAVVVDVLTGPGQVVAAGAPLLTVARLDPLWVKASVFAGDLARLDPNGPAEVDLLQESGTRDSRRARRVMAPPTADPLSASADVYYQLERSRGLRPGQRVDITVVLRGNTAARPVVPLGAIVYDQSGGAWVYVKEGERTYGRRRVLLAGIVDDWAILAQGPPPGTQVVVTGAAELFGTEFGAGK